MTQTAADSVKLIVKLQGQGSRTIDIVGDTFTIGRKTGNHLVIDDHTVSGRHARIVKVHSVFFVEDLQSTNGTSVNGRRIERQQLRDADVVTIGQHRLIFQDPAASPALEPPSAGDLERTMMIGANDASRASGFVPAKILVTRGRTDRSEYRLTQPVTLIGSQEGAAIRLTGWFAPKSAAQIFQRGGAYFISRSQGAKPLLVNGREISGQQQIKDGDQIQVAGITLAVSLNRPEK